MRDDIQRYLDQQRIVARTKSQIEDFILAQRGRHFFQQLQIKSHQVERGKVSLIEHHAQQASLVGNTPVYDLCLGIHRQEVEWEIEQIAHGVGSAPPGPILDIGCGTGLIACFLGKYYPLRAIEGIDYVPQMVGVSQRRAHSCRLPNVRFKFADFDVAPLSSSYAVTLFANSFGEGVADFTSRFQKAYDVLLPGGKILIISGHSGTEEEVRVESELPLNKKLWNGEWKSAFSLYPRSDGGLTRINYHQFVQR